MVKRIELGKRKLRVGIIGLGRIASLYEDDARAKAYYPCLTHAGSYARHPEVELICGADIDAERREWFGKKWGVKGIYADYREMLEGNDLDILSVCTHPEHHYVILQAARKKVKVIFCEKPFTRGSEEIEEIVQWQERDDAKITINLYREYDESHRRVRALLQQERYGAIQRVNCYIGKGLRNMGTHLLGYVMNTLGMPKEITVFNKSFSTAARECSYDVYLKFPGDIPCLIQACDYERFRLFEMDFVCTEGRLQILDEGLKIAVYEVGENRAETGAKELRRVRRGIRSTIGYALGGAVEHLVRLVREPALAPAVSPQRYLDIQRVIEEIEKQGGRIKCMHN